jgi:hypothetical protein
MELHLFCDDQIYGQCSFFILYISSLGSYCQYPTNINQKVNSTYKKSHEMVNGHTSMAFFIAH